MVKEQEDIEDKWEKKEVANIVSREEDDGTTNPLSLLDFEMKKELTC